MNESNTEHVTGLFTADAEKMRRLVAAAREMGDVAITMMNRFDPDSPLSFEEQQRQHALDQSPREVFAAMKGSHGPRLLAKMKRRGIRTVRDMLVVGYERLDLSEISRPRIIAAMQQLFPNEQFKALPTPADAAQLCDRLEQVTATVLGIGLLSIDPNLELPRDRHGQHIPFEQTWSVADILDETNLEPRRLLCYFAQCQEAAMQFATEFATAKRSIKR